MKLSPLLKRVFLRWLTRPVKPWRRMLHLRLNPMHARAICSQWPTTRDWRWMRWVESPVLYLPALPAKGHRITRESTICWQNSPASPREERAARFKCLIAITLPEEEVALCKGECRGIIAFEPKGENGFGYDPIFYLPGLGKTMADLSMDEKNGVSHRGQAVMKARRMLEQRIAWNKTVTA